MKKLLKAFTLAEILITLGIIGVVARVTLPSLTMNVQMQTTETSLAKAINTLESVNEKIKLEGNSRTLSRAIGDSKDQIYGREYLEAFPNYVNGVYKQQKVCINGANSNKGTFISKDGVMFIAVSGAGVRNKGTRYPKRYSGYATELIIDTNGAKAPNRYGKDQFYLYVDSYGGIIPHGGAEYAAWYNNNGAIPEPLWKEGCPSNKNKKPTDARSCTGAIVDNGYKILYGYNAL